jgi:hypothetical protein
MTEPEHLYRLLPAIYRRRDGESGQALRALLGLIDAEFEAVRADIETTWDNWFVETAEEWLVPYLASALRLPVTRDVAAISFSRRAFVANTIGYRRRKGTVGMVELLARDVTNYPTRAVESFRRVAWTEAINHREDRPGTIDIRSTARLERLSSPLSEAARRIDVRRIASGRGQHNLPNLGLYLWRTQIWRVGEVDAAPVPASGGRGWWMRPTGGAAPIFAPLETETDPAAVATEASVPMPLSRRRLWAQGGPPWPFSITLRGDDGSTETVPPERIDICHLDPLPAAPADDRVRVDPQAGVVLLGQSAGAGLSGLTVTTTHSIATPGLLGAGPWARPGPEDWLGRWTALPEAREVGFQVMVSRSETGTGIVATLEQAIAAWNGFVGALAPDAAARALGIILLGDSRTHAAPATPIRVPSGAVLGVIAASWPDRPDPAGGPDLVRPPGALLADETRPLIDGDIVVLGIAGPAQGRGEVCFDGLTIAGRIGVGPGSLDALRLASSTLLGGGLEVNAADGNNAALELSVARAVLGDVRTTGEIAAIEIADAAILGRIDAAGVAVSARGATVMGTTRAGRLEADDCIFEGLVDIDVQQEGCVRFSVLPPDSRTARRYRCQPETALDAAPDAAARARLLVGLRPDYRSLDPLAPGFLLLADTTPPEIRTAAEDGGEPGCWNHLQHHTRVSNLSNALPQFLRFGLEPGLFFLA